MGPWPSAVRGPESPSPAGRNLGFLGGILFLAWSRCADSESTLLGRSRRAIKWLLVTSERHKGWLRPGPPAKDEAVVSKQIATPVNDDLSIMFKSMHPQHYSKYQVTFRGWEGTNWLPWKLTEKNSDYRSGLPSLHVFWRNKRCVRRILPLNLFQQKCEKEIGEGMKL